MRLTIGKEGILDRPHHLGNDHRQLHRRLHLRLQLRLHHQQANHYHPHPGNGRLYPLRYLFQQVDLSHLRFRRSDLPRTLCRPKQVQNPFPLVQHLQILPLPSRCPMESRLRHCLLPRRTNPSLAAIHWLSTRAEAILEKPFLPYLSLLAHLQHIRPHFISEIFPCELRRRRMMIKRRSR